MRSATREVMVAGYGTADDAWLDYDALSRLDSNHLMDDHGIVLVTRDAKGRIHHDETGGGLSGRLVSHHVQRVISSRVEPGRASVVAVLDTEPRLLDKALSHARIRALVPVEGRGRRALDTAIAVAERDLERAMTASEVAPAAQEHPPPIRDAERELAQRLLRNSARAIPLGVLLGATIVLIASLFADIDVWPPVLMGAAFGAWAGLFFGAWAAFVSTASYLDETDETSPARRQEPPV